MHFPAVPWPLEKAVASVHLWGHDRLFFWMVATATAVSSGRPVMACLVLRILEFLIKALGQEYKW